MTEAEKGYAAGIIDGEGTIFLCRSKNKKADGSISFAYTAQVKVAMADRQVLDFLAAKWGGKVNPMKMPKNKPHWKQMYYWQLWAGSSEAFLRDVLPYLRVKNRQTRLLLRHRRFVQPRGARKGTNQGATRSDKLTAFHERIYNRIRSLNQREA